MLVSVLLELCIISLALAVTSKSIILTRFGSAFHGLFCSLVLMTMIPLPAAMMNLAIGAIITPLLISRTSANRRVNFSSPTAAAVAGTCILTSPILAALGLASWQIQISIQILLALFAFKSFKSGIGNIVALTGLGQITIVGLATLHGLW